MPHLGTYLRATRHPWPCLLFLLPLLVAYEAGVLWLGGTQPDALRNGADAWLRWGLEAFGLQQLYWPPVLIAIVFLCASWLRPEPGPNDLLSVWLGMAVESILFALGLWGLSRSLGPLLERMGIQLSLGPHQAVVKQLITFVGAGIYEELLFRLLLFSALVWLLKQIRVFSLLAVALAIIGSALLFAAAHHFGPYGEAFDGYTFLFRTLAGIYFALLYQLRGFGIVVGTHAFYDVLVGVLVN